jgi:Fic family protein
MLPGNAVDDGESTTMMDPLFLSESSTDRKAIAEEAFQLGRHATALSASLPKTLVESLADLVRSMNCYYSNLIEGHNTHPISIERALAGDYSRDKKKRDLQLEAKAHITVQRWIDSNPPKNPFAESFIREIHRRFYEEVPGDLCIVKNEKTGEEIQIIPGEYRTHFVEVGKHRPVSPGAVPRFMKRYEEFFSALSPSERIAAMGAAHHRLVWIHPFIDGNGRVSRLASHAVAVTALDSKALWSIARGLARRVDDYKGLLALNDEIRRGDLDGRGALSERNLAVFSKFFLNTCKDQISFMMQLMEPNSLRKRIGNWAREESKKDDHKTKKLPKHAAEILERLTYQGSLSPVEIHEMLKLTERQVRRIIVEMIDYHVLHQAAPGGNVTLAFPAEYAHYWMPNLFPERDPGDAAEPAEPESNEGIMRPGM